MNLIWNFLLFLLLLSSSSCSAQETSDITWEEDITKIFKDINGSGPGYMISVIEGDKILFQKGFGMADLEHMIPINQSSSFNIASLSKQFTAAAIAQLILDGKISLDDDVKPYFPNSNFQTGEIKLKHLIYMTSGINDYMYGERSNNRDWSSLDFFNIDTAMQASFATPLMYKPGTQWSYSNINYMLLTKIVEHVSKMPFSEFCSKRLFTPLGMNATIVNDDIFQVIPNRAHAYNYRDAENTDWLLEDGYLKNKGKGFLQIHRNSPHYGGSGVYTTMSDYNKWMINYHNKKMWGEEFYDLMHMTIKFEHDKSNDGFGIVHGEHLGQEITWYEGGDWGYSSYFMRFVNQDLSVVCFSNLGTGNSRKQVHDIVDVLQKSGLIAK